MPNSPATNNFAQAFTIGSEFIGDDHVALVLGDNIFFGAYLTDLLTSAVARPRVSSVFSYRVDNPERYSVVEFGKGRRVIGLEEKPGRSKSNHAVIVLYFFDNRVVEYALNLKPSARRTADH